MWLQDIVPVWNSAALLGAPIGSGDFSRQQKSIQKIENITSQLERLEDPMAQNVLMLYTLGQSKSKFVYFVDDEEAWLLIQACSHTSVKPSVNRPVFPTYLDPATNL